MPACPPRAALLLAVLIAGAAGGCRSAFSYHASEPLAAEPRYGRNVTVLSFTDATGAPGKSSDPLRSIGTVNLAKRPWENLASSLPQLTGTFLAKSLTLEIAASGLFRSVVFRKDPPKSHAPRILVSGTILRAEFSNPRKATGSLLLELEAEGRLLPEDRLLFKEKVLRQASRFPGEAETDHLKLNQLLQKTFGDIRRYLAAALEAEEFPSKP